CSHVASFMEGEHPPSESPSGHVRFRHTGSPTPSLERQHSKHTSDHGASRPDTPGSLQSGRTTPTVDRVLLVGVERVDRAPADKRPIPGHVHFEETRSKLHTRPKVPLELFGQHVGEVPQAESFVSSPKSSTLRSPKASPRQGPAHSPVKAPAKRAPIHPPRKRPSRVFEGGEVSNPFAAFQVFGQPVRAPVMASMVHLTEVEEGEPVRSESVDSERDPTIAVPRKFSATVQGLVHTNSKEDMESAVADASATSFLESSASFLDAQLDLDGSFVPRNPKDMRWLDPAWRCRSRASGGSKDSTPDCRIAHLSESRRDSLQDTPLGDVPKDLPDQPAEKTVAEVQCSDVDIDATAQSWWSEGRRLVIQRCSPGALSLQKWHRVEEVRHCNRLEHYLHSFRQRFPGTLDSRRELAKRLNVCLLC
ncbi:unnamed protein product, partial [Effrenium voratum]